MALVTKQQIEGMFQGNSSSEEQAMSQLASCLFHSQIQTHVIHLQAVNKSYPAHMALGDYYGGLEDLIDSTVEKWQGKYSIVQNYSLKPIETSTDAITHISSVAKEVEALRSRFSDGYIQQEIDNILAHIYQSLYRLKNLLT